MTAIELSLEGVRKLVQTVAQRLFLPDEERLQARGKALQEYGKGLQEVMRALSMDRNECLATIALMREMDIAETDIQALIERQPDALARMVREAYALRRRVRDGTILAAEVTDEVARKTHEYRPSSPR
jgi:hypothetical protein